jgi:hypothetical protein
MTSKGPAGQTDRSSLTRNLQGPDSPPVGRRRGAPLGAAGRSAPAHAPTRPSRRTPRLRPRGGRRATAVSRLGLVKEHRAGRTERGTGHVARAARRSRRHSPPAPRRRAARISTRDLLELREWARNYTGAGEGAQAPTGSRDSADDCEHVRPQRA